MDARPLVKFILAREAVRLNREAGFEKPWTPDPILQRFRFCNVNRNNDTVTKWIHENWLTPLTGSPDAWFAMVVARLINWPDSLGELTRTIMTEDHRATWKPKEFERIMDARRERGEKNFTGAYMIHASHSHNGTKAAYLAECVMTPMWEAREYLRPIEGEPLAAFAARLLTQRDMGTFMVGQIVADTKHQFGGALRNAEDWWTWAVSGPGSKRGLNRVLGREVNEKWKESDWKATLDKLRKKVTASIGEIYLDAQDLQNCLCEFDKYERVRLGQGKPRSGYPGV